MTRWILGFVCVAAMLCVSMASAQEEGQKKGRRGGPGGFNREEVIKKFDKDGDGKLNEDEQKEARKSMQEEFAKRREEMTKKFDKDGDGKLNDEEREAARKEFGGRGPGGRGPGGPGGASREELLKKFDTDKDGKLSETEREALRKEMGGRRGGRRPGGEKPAEEKKEA